MTPTPSHKPPSQETIDALVRIVGEEQAIRDEDAMAPYLVEWRDRYRGKAALVLRPGDTDEVSAILKLANETLTAIVPQGGNTGLVGGQIPFESGHEVVVALEPAQSRARHRPRLKHHDGRSRARARARATGGGKGRAAVPAEPRL